MGTDAEGWFIYASAVDQRGKPAELIRERFTLPAIGADEVLVEPLYGTWEGNMTHAVNRKPIDVCTHRHEPRVILGNAGTVRLLAVGDDCAGLRAGQLAVYTTIGIADPWGYPSKISAYDAPGTMGCLATRANLKRYQVVPIPEDSGLSAAQWAIFSGRYVIAWSNWRVAHGTLRLMVDEAALPDPHVWGWGGGTTLAELELARHFGCHTVMTSATESHLAEIERRGVTALDRRRFPGLGGDAAAERAFLAEVERATEGRGVQIFVDFIGGNFYPITLKALGREGVITTAGWQQGMVVRHLRASECIQRHQHVHTHGARNSEVVEAMRFALDSGWSPPPPEHVWPFDEIRELSEAHRNNTAGMFPIYRVNPE